MQGSPDTRARSSTRLNRPIICLWSTMARASCLFTPGSVISCSSVAELMFMSSGYSSDGGKLNVWLKLELFSLLRRINRNERCLPLLLLTELGLCPMPIPATAAIESNQIIATLISQHKCFLRTESLTIWHKNLKAR